MNSNVIHLPLPSPRPAMRCWECECGSQTFHLLDTGEVLCAECGAIITSLAVTGDDDG